jgi:alpha-D-ribose 1-methylphosphonate 5-triphosphate synthase subunit PhnG
MTPETCFAALAVADRDRLAVLAEQILELADSVDLVAGPRPATMLVELTESVRAQPFYLGEVVVTEATVRINGCRGDSTILGLDEERALAAAVCDAAAEAGVLAAEVARLVQETEAGQAAARSRTAAALADTRISVEVMA